MTSSRGEPITATASVGIWYDAETGHIHLAVPQSDWFVTTINDTPGSKRRHHNLYLKLARYLRESGKPYPDLADLGPGDTENDD